MPEQRFGRSFGSLDAIFGFVEGFLDGEGIDTDPSFEIQLVIEELFTNMVKYSRDGHQDIAISLEREGPRLVIRLRDFDVEPFDVTRVPTADVDQPITERTRGGLGLHLVRQVADDFRYDYRDRNSTITVIKRLET
jgi:anti-sigma regulatory factor (Ser/Thr protein kinase)